MDSTIKQKIFRLAEQVAEDQGVELFDIELLGKGKTLLRVFIDRDGGITLKECEDFSKGLSILLDVENPIPGPYTLEVSSPGLNRPLRTIADYQKNVGKLARIITRERIDNQSFFIGYISNIHHGIIQLRVGEHDVFIPFENISRANLEIDI